MGGKPSGCYALFNAFKPHRISLISIHDFFSSHTGLCFAKGALEALANLCDGDARAALNGLEMAIAYHDSNQDEAVITEQQIASVLQRNHVLYDRNGEEHYNIISAFHKSIRGSDGNAALYWLARMLEGGEDPLYVARRMIRIASEDVGMEKTEFFFISNFVQYEPPTLHRQLFPSR